jgi:hypothetical protein
MEAMMTKASTRISKFKAGALGAALIASTITAISPAQARDRWDDDRIDAGDVIAGAIIIGGLAAILSSGNDRGTYYRDGGYDGYRSDGYRDGRYRGSYDGWGYDRRRYGGSRDAVNRCVAAAERRASYNGRADVTEITDIDRVRGGYEVRGRIVVQNAYRDRGYGYDRYGYGSGYNRGYDRGSFTCLARYGQVDGLRFNGLR